MKRLVKNLLDFVPENEEQKDSILSFKQAIDAFGESIFYRENLPAHVCSTIWVVNPERTKSLMAYHNIYETFTWFGGHADGEKDLLFVAKKELREEASIENFKVLNDDKPIDYLTSCVLTHTKRGKIVPNHIHYSPIYIFEVSEMESFQIKQDENSAIKWVDNKDIMELISEKDSVKAVYKRILQKIEEKNI